MEKEREQNLDGNTKIKIIRVVCRKQLIKHNDKKTKNHCAKLDVA